MRKKFLAVVLGLGVTIPLISAPPATAQPSGGNTGFVRWVDIGLRIGTASGSAYLGAHGVTLRRGGTSGSWTSPAVSTNPIDTLNPSWQAKTPPGSSVNSELRVYSQQKGWSGWFKMGLWTFGNTPTRTSVNEQNDPDFGRVFTDTYVNTTDNPVTAYQTRIRLSASGNNRPTVRQVAVQAAATHPFTQVSPTTMRRTVDLPVPKLAQYVLEGAYPAYGGGGEAWCSPTSVAMVLKYYHTGPTQRDVTALPPDPVFDSVNRVNGEAAYAAIHTYDAAYEGTGNWPFNTAYAAEYGLDTAVRVFPDLQSVEAEILRGNPVVVSIAWDNTNDDPSDDLPGTGIPSSGGHLMVVRGFTADGGVITNDPATHVGNSDVRRVYSRLEFERQWLSASNGTAYTFARR